MPRAAPASLGSRPGTSRLTMADRVFFIAGSPSELLGGHIVPPQMVEDLLVIAGISREALDRIAASLENAVGFVNDEELKQLVQEILPAEREVSAVLMRSKASGQGGSSEF